MNPDAQVVGVVAFFREPGDGAVWKLAVSKKQWKKTDPVKIEVRDNTLVLVDAKDRPIVRSAPQQSAPAPKPKASVQPGTQDEG